MIVLYRTLARQHSPMVGPGYQLEILSFSAGNVLLAATVVVLIYKTRNLIPKVVNMKYTFFQNSNSAFGYIPI